jgi:hypothetical protein
MDEHILRPVAAWKELGGHRKLGIADLFNAEFMPSRECPEAPAHSRFTPRVHFRWPLTLRKWHHIAQLLLPGRR